MVVRGILGVLVLLVSCININADKGNDYVSV